MISQSKHLLVCSSFSALLSYFSWTGCREWFSLHFIPVVPPQTTALPSEMRVLFHLEGEGIIRTNRLHRWLKDFINGFLLILPFIGKSLPGEGEPSQTPWVLCSRVCELPSFKPGCPDTLWIWKSFSPA